MESENNSPYKGTLIEQSYMPDLNGRPVAHNFSRSGNIDMTNGSNGSNIKYPTNKVGQIGLRDKYDQGAGLVAISAEDVQTTTTEYTYIVDTRDCVGSQSLGDAQYVAKSKGIRVSAQGRILGTSSIGVYPMIITLDSVLAVKNGDTITIKGVTGNTNANGISQIDNVTITVPNTGEGTITINKAANSDYQSGGTWTRIADSGYPEQTNKMSIIDNNMIIANLGRTLKMLRSVALYNIVIPRDIIPLQVYLSDFIEVSTNYTDISYPGITDVDYTTFIKEEPRYTNNRMLGFYSTPLDLWRSYINGNMSIPDAVTPAPLQLWNPPRGPWPNQPIPYPFQTVPTYMSNDFNVPNTSGLFHLILAGYGVYDMLDWTSSGSTPTADALMTSIMRKLLLILIVPKQSYREADYVSLIIASNTTDPGSVTYPYGYGSYQRFVPGPGLGQNYQPGTNQLFPGNPTQITTDNPVNFPHFRGNVWGPYSGPGALFQSNGTRTTIQDLYLNGDLNNLFGAPIVLPDVPTEGIPNHPTFGLNFLGSVEVNLGNIQTATNINIVNAMRLVPNGFGTVTVRAQGSGGFYTNRYNQTGGGQGPSTNSNGTWVNRGLYTVVGGTLDDPVAKGPLNSDLGPESASAETDINEIMKSNAYYDLGPNQGQFMYNLLKYIDYAVNDIPDTDLVIKLEESDRDIKSISTNSANGPALISCSVRLSIGSTNGTQQYIESVQSLVSVCSGFWEFRYGNPKGKLDQMHLRFYTYDGTPIPLEKMLQQRRTTNLLTLTNRISESLSGIQPFNIPYLFDPLDPRLIGRVKRYFQLMFKIVCYESVAPGLLPESNIGISPYSSNLDSMNPYS